MRGRTQIRRIAGAALVALGLLAPPAGPVGADEPGTPLGPVAPSAGAPFEVGDVQGILAMLRLDGWLLYDGLGQNPVALEVVRPTRAMTRRWFVLIPARGEPVALVHRADAAGLAHLPGRRIEYAGWRDLDAGLRELTKGRRRLAMEYSPRAEIPEASRIDAGTWERVRALGVEIVSSAELTQAARTRWGKEGRATHYAAVHHLVALRDDALAFVAAELAAGRKVTERDVAARIARGLGVRGLETDGAPVVAAGPDSADPEFTVPAKGARAIQPGDLVLLHLWGRVAGRPDAIYADLTWMAYVGSEVPARYAEVFAVAARARDAATQLIADRARSGRPVRGFEADRAARDVIAKAGLGEQFVHRTGHSLTSRHHGAGANLDDLEAHDTRSLLAGAGFVIAPGVYLAGEFGVRAGVSCHVGGAGLEVTTPVQTAITPIVVAAPVGRAVPAAPAPAPAPAKAPAADEGPLDPY